VKSTNDFKEAFDKIADPGLQAISMQAGGLFFQSREAIAALQSNGGFRSWSCRVSFCWLER
jgi:hypothetical protein